MPRTDPPRPTPFQWGALRADAGERRGPRAASEGPALRLGDQEVAERLDARDRAHLLGVDEVAVERRHLDVAQDLDQPAGAVDRVGGQHAEAGPGLDRE